MAWDAKPGGSLLIPSGTYHDPSKRHLFIICKVSPTHALMVSISTWLNDLCDGSCVLEKDQHPFIKHKSYVQYRKARIEALKDIKAGIDKGVLIPNHDVNQECFNRVCDGFEKSKFVPWKMKQAWKKWK